MSGLENFTQYKMAVSKSGFAEKLTASLSVFDSSDDKHNLKDKKCTKPEVDDGKAEENDICQSNEPINASTAYSKKTDETNKSNRKRLKPGKNSRPRPKDCKMIQDRMKELRGIVPNGVKVPSFSSQLLVSYDFFFSNMICKCSVALMHYLNALSSLFFSYNNVSQSMLTS